MTDIFPKTWKPYTVTAAQKMLDILGTAAKEGRRAPSNAEIAKHLMIAEPTIGRIIRQMNDEGIVSVCLYDRCWKQVTILKGEDAGHSTSPHPAGGEARPYYNTPSRRNIETVDAVVKHACEICEAPEGEVIGVSRATDVVNARAIIAWVAHRGFGLESSCVGRRVKRDASTISLSSKWVVEEGAQKPKFMDLLRRVSEAVAGELGAEVPKMPDQAKRSANKPAARTPVVDDLIGIIASFAETGRELPDLHQLADMVGNTAAYVKIVLKRMLTDGNASLRHEKGVTYFRLVDGIQAIVTNKTVPFKEPGAVQPQPEQRHQTADNTRTAMSPKASPEIELIRRMQADQMPLPAPRTCQWLDGEPRDRNFCGKPSLPGSSYCAEHHARCWYKAPGKTGGETGPFHLFKQQKPSGNDARF